MPDIANVSIHSSQFPDAVRRDLLASLRSRKINPKFHYDSLKQTRKWLALHQAYSPSRNDSDCAAIYDSAFDSAAGRLRARGVHVIGLGCGGGQKDTRLLKRFRAAGRKLFYTPSDVSVAMCLVARETARVAVPAERCRPIVCDLEGVGNLTVLFKWPAARAAARIMTFFGMIPNFEPEAILPKLASAIRRNDLLLFSANLAPGRDYAAGVGRILPQYDNALTRDWLMTLLLDLGIERRDGRVRFAVETGTLGLKKVVARFHFSRACRIQIESRTFAFRAGESIRLFFSYRYTPERIRAALARVGLLVREEWITRSGEEGVFLCERDSRRQARV